MTISGIPNKSECLKYIREISRLHGLIVEADQTTLEYAIEAGGMLIALKKTVEHGDWLGYLAENFPDISERTAQDYMWAANKRKAIEEEKEKAENGESRRLRKRSPGRRSASSIRKRLSTTLRSTSRWIVGMRGRRAERSSAGKDSTGNGTAPIGGCLMTAQ
jgi:hypothetical protein